VPDPLVVVDVQRGFLNTYTEHIPARIRRLIQTGDYEPLFFTRFINSEGSAYHRLLDWHACAGPPETDLVAELGPFVAEGALFDKHGLTGLPESLGARLEELGLRQTAIAGIDTDMCVLKTAMDIFDMGIEPRVLIDCCASTAGLQAHLAGLAILSRNLGPHQLQLTGLGGSYLAPPPDAEDERPDG
jgi:nicotinamidase-related amidase